MGGAASSPNYAKIYVDVVNQESTEAGASRVGLVLPVYADVFAAVEDQAVTPGKRKRSRVTGDVDAFINDGARMDAVADYFASSFKTGLGLVMRDVMTDGKKFQHIAMGANLALIVSDSRDAEWKRSKALYTMAVTLGGDMKAGKSVTMPFSLSIWETDAGHANTGVIKYNAATRDLLVLLFEPHARVTRLNEVVTRALDSAMNAIIKKYSPNDPVSVRVVSPHSGMGLQGKDPLCAVWSILMLLVYLLNCEAGREKRCSFGRVQGVMTMLWRRRRHIMPAWLYTLHMYVPRGVERDEPYRARRKIHDTALDAAQCRDREPGECTHPCAVDSRTGVCYNTRIFIPKRE